MQKTSKMILIANPEDELNMVGQRVALFNEDGTQVDFTGVATTGAAVLLTGMVAGTADDVAATDTINEAVAKLQAQAKVHPVGSQILLTGLTTGDAVAVGATDTVNEAIAKLQAEVEVDVTGADVLLTGMVAGSNTTVDATDTVNEAIAKLQAQSTALAALITSLDSRVTALEPT